MGDGEQGVGARKVEGHREAQPQRLGEEGGPHPQADDEEVIGAQVDSEKVDGPEVIRAEVDREEVDGPEVTRAQVHGKEVDRAEVIRTQVDGAEVDPEALVGVALTRVAGGTQAKRGGLRSQPAPLR